MSGNPDPLQDPLWDPAWSDTKNERFWSLLAQYKSAKEDLSSSASKGDTERSLERLAQISAEIRDLYE